MCNDAVVPGEVVAQSPSDATAWPWTRPSVDEAVHRAGSQSSRQSVDGGDAVRTVLLVHLCGGPRGSSFCGPAYSAYLSKIVRQFRRNCILSFGLGSQKCHDLANQPSGSDTVHPILAIHVNALENLPSPVLDIHGHPSTAIASSKCVLCTRPVLHVERFDAKISVFEDQWRCDIWV